MTITGAGARSTIIDANRLSRVLNVATRAQGLDQRRHVHRRGLLAMANPGSRDIFNGDGGAILAFGALTLTDVTVTATRPRSAAAGSSPSRSRTSSARFPSRSRSFAPRSAEQGREPRPGDGQGGGIAPFGELSRPTRRFTATGSGRTGEPGGGIVSTNGLTDRELHDHRQLRRGRRPTGGGMIRPGRGPHHRSMASSRPSTRSSPATPSPGRRSTARSADVTLTDNNISGDDSCGFTDPGSKEDTDPALFGPAKQRRAHGHAELPAHQPGAGHRDRHGVPRHRPARHDAPPARHLRHRRGGAGAAHRRDRRRERPHRRTRPRSSAPAATPSSWRARPRSSTAPPRPMAPPCPRAAPSACARRGRPVCPAGL